MFETVALSEILTKMVAKWKMKKLPYRDLLMVALSVV